MYDEAKRTLGNLNIRAFDPAKQRIERSAESLSRWVYAQHESRPFDVVYIDYAQKIKSADPAIKNLYEKSLVASESVYALAKDLGIAVVVGSQITLGGKDGVDTTKGGRHWEEDAGLVIRIEKPKDTDPQDLRTLTLTYNRMGKSGNQDTYRWNERRLTLEAF